MFDGGNLQGIVIHEGWMRLICCFIAFDGCFLSFAHFDCFLSQHNDRISLRWEKKQVRLGMMRSSLKVTAFSPPKVCLLCVTIYWVTFRCRRFSDVYGELNNHLQKA